MPIYRAPKTDKYAMILNRVFQDEGLSWEARGVGGYILTKPDGWEVRVYDLVRRGPARQAKVRRIIKELERAHYLYRQRIRLPNGEFTWTTFMYEDPQMNPRRRRSGRH